MSLSDWTDKAHGEHMVITTAQKYEGEKSLKVHAASSSDHAIKILDMSEAVNPKSVNVTFWFYSNVTYGYLGHFFRYQDVDNYYVVTIKRAGTGSLRVYLSLMEGGIFTQGGDALITVDSTVWQHIKIEFCAVGGTVYATIYYEEGGEWIEGAVRALSPEKFVSGGAYGVGYRGIVNSNVDAYMDLTKVYY